jgi:hypothetical protein
VDEGALCLDHHAELTNDKDWGATLAGWARTWRSITRATTRRRPRATGAAGGAAGRSGGAGRAGAHRLADGDAPAQVRLAEAAIDRSGDAAERAALAMRAAELAETAAHDLPRAAALARRALEAVPGTRRRRTCWNGCTRRWGSGASW